jgi:L-rhamnose-H+ transport protein
MMGMIISIGSLFPLLIGGPANVTAASILAVIAGVAVIIAGVVFSAWAAVIKENDQADDSESAENPEKKSFTKGLIICLVAGVTAPMLNFAFIYGEAIRTTAAEMGVSQTLAPNAVWAVTLLGGFFVNIVYTLAMVQKNKNWKLFREEGTGIYYFYTFLMGLLWAGSIIVYGMAAANLGELGASIGWAAFNATGIFWANCLGLFTREWKGVGSKGMSIMRLGLIVLLAGVFIVGLAKAL